jgi:hypothetical protein
MDHRWISLGVTFAGLDYEEWEKFKCSQCGSVVCCDRTEPDSDPDVEQDCNAALIQNIMES